MGEERQHEQCWRQREGVALVFVFAVAPNTARCARCQTQPSCTNLLSEELKEKNCLLLIPALGVPEHRTRSPQELVVVQSSETQH